MQLTAKFLSLCLIMYWHNLIAFIFCCFTCSICVSSRDSDGGVHEVIQSLVRHLISKICLGYEAKRKIDDTSLPLMSLPKKSKPNQNFVKRFEPLQVNIFSISIIITTKNNIFF